MLSSDRTKQRDATPREMMVGQAKASLIKIKTLLLAEGWSFRDYRRLISSGREGAAAFRRRPRRRCLEFTAGSARWRPGGLTMKLVGSKQEVAGIVSRLEGDA